MGNNTRWPDLQSIAITAPRARSRATAIGLPPKLRSNPAAQTWTASGVLSSSPRCVAIRRAHRPKMLLIGAVDADVGCKFLLVLLLQSGRSCFLWCVAKVVGRQDLVSAKAL